MNQPVDTTKNHLDLYKEAKAKKLIPFSYSSMSMYHTCEFKWKMKYHDKIRDDQPSIHLVFGNAMHDTIQNYLHLYYNKPIKESKMFDYESFLKQQLVTRFKEIKRDFKSDGSFTSGKELTEFYQQGVATVSEFIKDTNKYFKKQNWELVGVEVPLSTTVQDKFCAIGFLDVVIRNIKTGEILIRDIKTSTRTWKDSKKKDPTVTDQLLFYKYMYSLEYNVDIKLIDVDFLIFKRTINENSDYPQSRIQVYSPASGKVKLNQFKLRLNEFINNAYDFKGDVNTNHVFEKTKYSEDCAFCHIKRLGYCAGV